MSGSSTFPLPYLSQYKELGSFVSRIQCPRTLASETKKHRGSVIWCGSIKGKNATDPYHADVTYYRSESSRRLQRVPRQVHTYSTFVQIVSRLIHFQIFTIDMLLPAIRHHTSQQ